MKSTIYCTVSDKGLHSFYLTQNTNRYYLFTQNYRKSVHNYYKNGVSLEDAVNFNKSNHDTALMHTMDKLPAYIKYVEKEYEIIVFEKTRRKKTKEYNHKKLRLPRYSFTEYQYGA